MHSLYLRDVLSDHYGYLYGWCERDTVVVAGVMDEGYERACERVKQAGNELGVQLGIVGQARMYSEDQGSGTPERRETHRLPLALEFREGRLVTVTTTEDRVEPPRVIFYSPPGRLEMLSSCSLPLEPAIFARRTKSTPGSSAQSVKVLGRLAAKRGDFDSDIASTLERINTCPSVVKQIHSERPSDTATASLEWHSGSLVRLVQAGFGINIATLSFPLPWVGPLRDNSTAARQIVTRLELLQSAPRHYLRYLTLCSAIPCDDEKRSRAYANYIRFWNTVWLFLNDLIVGYALSSFVRDNALELSRLVETLVQTYISGYLRALLQWLSDWPGGVKLNSELSSLICEAFLFLSRLWDNFILTPLLPHLPSVLKTLSILGFVGGASLLLAFASDLFHLLTFPFFGCYIAATAVFRWSLIGLSALFNVFCGKKYNPLRARTEPATYSVDALLLGTILFVVLIFLFPTIAAFYLAFASSRLTIVAVQAGFGVAIQALNAFPLFALMLRLKSPRRLPHSVTFASCSDRRHYDAPHLHIENQPLPLGLILADLTSLAKAFFSPKTQLSLFSRLCKGKIIFSSPLRTDPLPQCD